MISKLIATLALLAFIGCSSTTYRKTASTEDFNRFSERTFKNELR